jgi:hypothetical protein
MTPSPPALEDLTPHQLVAEIRQIAEQYRAEVSTKRRTWPTSIRERACALRRQGVSAHKIADLSGIPYTTLANWFGQPRSRPKREEAGCRAGVGSGRFLPVVQGPAGPTKRGRPRVNPTVGPTTVVSPTTVPTTVVGLTVVLPGGFEVRGIPFVADVAELYRLTGGQR